MRRLWLLIALLLVLPACAEEPPPADDDDATDDDDVVADDDDSASDDDDDVVDYDDSAVDDDDDDSAVDDDDDDDSAPAPELVCPGVSLPCATVGGTTIGAVDNVQDWSACGGDGAYTGGEDVFRFAPGGDGEVTFTLSWADAELDLDVFVLDDCDPGAACLGSSVGSNNSESVTVPATAGVPITVVVDGKDGAESAYQLDADCSDVVAVEVGTSVVGITYCLDWNSVNVVTPPGLITLLQTFGGIDITQFPVLLNPTSADTAASEIEMLAAVAATATCDQEPLNPVLDVTAGQPGLFVDPYFEVGPSTLTLLAPGLIVTVHETIMTGLFTEEADQITDGTVVGMLEVPPDFSATACSFITCYPCPTGTGVCTDFAVDSAVWDDNGAGPLVP